MLSQEVKLCEIVHATVPFILQWVHRILPKDPTHGLHNTVELIHLHLLKATAVDSKEKGKICNGNINKKGKLFLILIVTIS